ncbi:MAG: hypothetical protein P4M01_05110 [Acidobacteriota bacterium]|nr:hypothetical protein [Acidobacteriota bacterium]
MALMTVLMGSVVLCLNTGQKSFRRSEVSSALDQQLRAAQQLLTQDLSQAGLPGGVSITSYTGVAGIENPLPLTTTTSAVTATGSQTVSVVSTGALFAGQSLLIGTGSAQEPIIISSINSTTSFTAYFSQTHTTSGIPLIPYGTFALGVTPEYPVTSSTNSYNSLWVYGDLLSNGSVTLARYVCPDATTKPYYTDSSGTRWAPLVRYEYDNILSNTTTSVLSAVPTTMNVLDLVAVNSSVGCFTVTPKTVTVTYADGTTHSDTFITSVTVYLRAMAGMVSSDGNSVTPQMDPDTHAPVIANRSFLDLSPRNIVAAYNYANWCATPTSSGGLGVDNNLAMQAPPVIQALFTYQETQTY